MSGHAVRYPDDYTGFRYDDPDAPLPPITKETVIEALDAGRAARKNPAQPAIDDQGRMHITILNPYAGKSHVLSEMWLMGYRGCDTAEGRARWEKAMRLLEANEETD